MVELYIDGKLADIGKDVGIVLQKEFSTDKGSVSEAEFSYTVDLPITDTNKGIFRFADSFDVSMKFSRTYDARLVSDGSFILQGKFKLSEITYSEYKGNLYSPKRKSVSDVLGDRTLNEIEPHYKMIGTMDDFTKLNNYVADLDANNIPTSEYRDRHVCFPYLLYSAPYNARNRAIENVLDMYTQDLAFGNHSMTSENLLPSYNVLSLLKDMFETEGYNVIGNVFEDNRMKDMYQTFQGNYSDWKNLKMTPYYLDFSCSYSNYKSRVISKTLQTAVIWTEDGINNIARADASFDGDYSCGVDAPLVAGSWNSDFTIRSNDQNIMARGESTDGYVIRVPHSGWYRIKCNGSMEYPQSSSANTVQDDTERVGGTTSRADCTDLANQPFEFQVKTGSPLVDPKLYSFVSFIPSIPTNYSCGESVVLSLGGKEEYQRRLNNNDIDVNDVLIDPQAWVALQTNEAQRKYPKNGKTMLIKDYSGFDTKDLICGARLGGAWFSGQWGPARRGLLQRPQRFARKGAGLALPRADRNLTIRGMEDAPEKKYFQTCAEDDNSTYEYAEDTALVMIAEKVNDKKAYSNFDGYNIYSTNGSWDTSDNGKLSYEGADDSQAWGGYKNSGSWDINTCVWLEEGDTIDFEVVMPLHTSAEYTHSTAFRHSRWDNRVDWINITNVRFDFKMALVSSDEEWYPSQELPIKPFSEVTSSTPTNVNMFLPNVKCNDYLNSFLKTFNLELTMPSERTFSIDYRMFDDKATNIIDLDEYANPSEAVFRAVETPTSRQLAFKVNKEECGYKIGNLSPYSSTSEPWDVSGYSGDYTIVNDANTEGTLDKTESQWSYSWYRDIRFINGIGLTPSTAKVNTLATANEWGMSVNWASINSSNLNTNKQFRLFFLAKDDDTEMYKYIEFPYAKDGDNYKNARLLLTSNYMTKKTLNGVSKYYLDYNENGVNPPNKTITDSYFSFTSPWSYEIETEAMLPNDVYARINGGTMLKFNDGIYKIIKVEGHDIEGLDTSTIIMRTLD